MKGSIDPRESEYSNDEERVAQWFYERGVGGGDDPIGAMLAGYALVVNQRNQLRETLILVRNDLHEAMTLLDRDMNNILGGSTNGKSEANNHEGRGLSRSG